MTLRGPLTQLLQVQDDCHQADGRQHSGIDFLTRNCFSTSEKNCCRKPLMREESMWAYAIHATSTSRELSYDMGAMFCSREKASTLSTVATSACKTTEHRVNGFSINQHWQKPTLLDSSSWKKGQP